MSHITLIFNKFVELVLENSGDFIDSVEYRKRTSVYNKDEHQNVIDALKSDDITELMEALCYVWYQKPLAGVISCSNYMSEDLKMELLVLHREFRYNLQDIEL